MISIFIMPVMIPPIITGIIVGIIVWLYMKDRENLMNAYYERLRLLVEDSLVEFSPTKHDLIYTHHLVPLPPRGYKHNDADKVSRQTSEFYEQERDKVFIMFLCYRFRQMTSHLNFDSVNSTMTFVPTHTVMSDYFGKSELERYAPSSEPDYSATPLLWDVKIKKSKKHKKKGKREAFKKEVR